VSSFENAFMLTVNGILKYTWGIFVDNNKIYNERYSRTVLVEEIDQGFVTRGAEVENLVNIQMKD